MARAYQAVLVATFCALICLPSLTLLVGREAPPLYGVKPLPYPPVAATSEWPTEFERYFQQNFGYKRQLVQLHNLLGYRVLGDLQSDSVLVGRKDWLFLKQDHGWESFRSEDPLSASEANGWQRAFQRAQQWLQRQEIPFLFVIVPSKETIYGEYLPAGATRARPLSRLDEVLTVLRSAGIEHLDLRAGLLEAKARTQVYDRIDSHWNGYGAQAGAELILKRVAELLQRPAAFAELNARVTPKKSDGDLSMMLSLDDFVSEQSSTLVPNQRRARRVEPPEGVLAPTRQQQNRMVFEVPDESLPTALLLRDSFSEALMPTLAEKFRRSVWIWTHALNLSAVGKEQPDIVIVELTERFLVGRPPRFTTAPRRR